jgi:hypothetical protein
MPSKGTKPPLAPHPKKIRIGQVLCGGFLIILALIAAIIIPQSVEPNAPTEITSPPAAATPTSNPIGKIQDFLSSLGSATSPSTPGDTALQPTTVTPPTPTTTTAELSPTFDLKDITISDSGLSKLILASLDLKEAVFHEGPYQRELQTFLRLAKKHTALIPYLEILQAHAETGIVPLATLQQNFNSLANQLNKTEIITRQTNSYIQKILSYLLLYVNIRKIDPHTVGTTPQAIVARSIAFVHQGNIRASLGNMQQLEGDAHHTASFWLADAAAYVNSQDALRAIFEYLQTLAYNIEEPTNTPSLPHS